MSKKRYQVHNKFLLTECDLEKYINHKFSLSGYYK